ncbi:hypothetical protein [Hymenobacter sp. BT491]|nr:hypothetical protein [Hymenobacter sp. BT491]MBC6992355.1 hypothetical protein [Hymenobacter sp. BT491]
MINHRNQRFDATVQLDPVKRQLTFHEARPQAVPEQAPAPEREHPRIHW